MLSFSMSDNKFSRTPNQDISSFYPCEIINSNIPIPARRKDKKWAAACRRHVDPWHHCNVKIMSQDFLEVFFMFFQYKIRYFVVSKKMNPLFVWGWDRKIRPSWSPFVITRQASWCQLVILRTDFSTSPYTHDGFLYSHLPMIIISMNPKLYSQLLWTKSI